MRLCARSDVALATLAAEVRTEQLRRRGNIHLCKACGREFIARNGAQTCSSTCRVRHMRVLNKTTRKGPKMMGVGYQDLSVDDLIAQLHAEGVNVLVDVRFTPLSRKSGFSKRGLAEALRAAGIRYIHDRRLGNPKDNRAAYAQTTSAKGLEARDRFRKLLSKSEGAAGVRELAELAEKESVALLCFEADESHCHREQVMSAVRDARKSLVGV